MLRRAVISVVSVGAVIAGTLGLTAATAGSASGSNPPLVGHLLRANTHEALPLHGGTVDSLNWSGYAVVPTTDDITAVTSTFTVPSASLLPPGFAATWTGIGGYSSSDLIQAGAAESSLPSNGVLGDQYYAWYELLPGAETQLTGCSGDAACTVTPGETMAVSISEVSGTTWKIAVTNTDHWTWSKDVTYTSSKSSAEWILEAPSLSGLQTLVAPVGTAKFGPTSSFTAGGATKTIAEGDPTTIDLSPGLINEATPSALAAGGQSFDSCTYAQSCPTP